MSTKIDFQKWAIKLSILFLSALLYAFGIKVFVSSARTYSSGLGSIPQLLTYGLHVAQRWYSVLYLAFNMPLIIIFWFILRRRFIILTFIWLLMQLFWGEMLELIPYVQDSNPFDIAGATAATSFLTINKAGWPVIVQSITGGLLIGIGIGLSWKTGGCSGGTDIVVCWYTTKHQKSVGLVAFIVSSVVTTFSIAAELIILGNTGNHRNILQKTLGVRTIGTAMYIMITTYFIDSLYPRFKKISVIISSRKTTEILAKLKDLKYVRGYVKFHGVSGYTNEKTENIRTVMLFLELKRFVQVVQSVDPNCWISTHRILKVFGRFVFNDLD